MSRTFLRSLFLGILGGLPHKSNDIVSLKFEALEYGRVIVLVSLCTWNLEPLFENESVKLIDVVLLLLFSCHESHL